MIEELGALQHVTLYTDNMKAEVGYIVPVKLFNVFIMSAKARYTGVHVN
jgi:hypothetical protein